MSSTKIINVLRTDKLDDIIDTFKGTGAKDVIFVLPKKGRSLNSEEHFELISALNLELGKNISVLTQDPAISNMAQKKGFHILTTAKPKREKPVAALAKNNDDIEPTDVDENVPLKEPRIADDGQITDDEQSGQDNLGGNNLNDDVAINDYDEENYAFDENFENKNLGLENNEDDEDSETEDKYLSELESTSGLNQPHYEALTILKNNRIVRDIIAPISKKAPSIKITPQTLKNPNLKVETNKIKEDEVKDLSQFNKENFKDREFNELKKNWKSQSGIWSDNFKLKADKIPKINLGSFNFGGLSKKFIWLLAGLAVILLGTVIYISTGNAEIIIEPQKKDLNITLKVKLSDKYLNVDTDSAQIPSQLFIINGRAENSFPATGERNVAQKARGKIMVYNEYGTTPQVLIITTRFESENKLIFRTLTNITVPGTKVVNGQIIPGSIEVDVIADKAGSNYNVPAGQFGIAAFREKGDSGRYQKIYGKSSSPMSGGVAGKAKVVTEKDFNDATSNIEALANENATKELDSKSFGLELIKIDSLKSTESASNERIDQAIDTFSVNSTVTVGAMGFKKEDILILINNYLNKNGNLTTLIDKVDIEILNPNFKQETGILEADFKISGFAYAIIDKEKILTELKGKNEENIRNYIKNINEIKSAKVILSPFWVNKIPKDPTKAKIEIQYN